MMTTMRPKFNIVGRVVGYTITMEEMKVLRKVARQAPGSKTKFDALNIFREAGLLETVND